MKPLEFFGIFEITGTSDYLIPDVHTLVMGNVLSMTQKKIA